jgi:hypothetical protein
VPVVAEQEVRGQVVLLLGQLPELGEQVELVQQEEQELPVQEPQVMEQMLLL